MCSTRTHRCVKRRRIGEPWALQIPWWRRILPCPWWNPEKGPRCRRPSPALCRIWQLPSVALGTAQTLEKSCYASDEACRKILPRLNLLLSVWETGLKNSLQIEFFLEATCFICISSSKSKKPKRNQYGPVISSIQVLHRDCKII